MIPKKTSVNHEVTISMTSTEWAEVSNALYTKIRTVKNGHYNMDVTKKIKARWLKDLRSAERKLNKALDKAGVPV